jgi:hypothetical protein
VGANSYSYNSGAGHSITRRWGFKQYDNPGTFTPELTVFNAITNRTCDATVSVGGVGVAATSEAAVGVFPNPLHRGEGLEIRTEKPIRKVRLMDMMGVEVFAMNSKGSDLSTTMEGVNLAAGVYVVEVVCEGGNVARKRVVVE